MGFMDSIMAGAEKRRAAEGQAEGNEGTNTPALGLQLPDKQTIGAGCITWRWDCLDGDVNITAILVTADDPEHELINGQFIVQLAFNDVEGLSPKAFLTFTADETFELGQTLISARNWEFEWKKYAADYLLKWMNESSETDTFVEPTSENTTIEFDGRSMSLE